MHAHAAGGTNESSCIALAYSVQAVPLLSCALLCFCCCCCCASEGYSWAEDKEHCEEYGRMLNADPSKVSEHAGQSAVNAWLSLYLWIMP
jgi:hypothetical protein